jgi:glycosyltransferase involved in cell wall biosynthesis
MKIGIQVSSDLRKRTGVEEYVYQLLKHLPNVDDSKNHQLFLLAPFISNEVRNIAGYMSKNLKWPFKKGWTQLRLSWEMLKNKPDILFIPAHTFPIIHPKLIITIHGLEYEHLPKAYSFWQRKILRYLTKRNAKKAQKIIVPSGSTKKDLVSFYRIDPGKIFVIRHGVSKGKKQETRNKGQGKYILYLGTGHKRKNVDGLKKAFKILKQRHNIPHELILGGVEKHVAGDEKWQLLRNADVFVFPSFYEGFGFPVLEAQAAGVPVVASNVSSLLEILGNSALLINPHEPEEIAEAVYKIIKNPDLKKDLIKKGQENIKRFSWPECAKKTLKVITL